MDTPISHDLDAKAPKRWLLSLLASSAAVLVCLAAIMLWMRFGEAVYLNGLVTALMNCF
jgi:hypothetical protein